MELCIHYYMVEDHSPGVTILGSTFFFFLFLFPGPRDTNRPAKGGKERCGSVGLFCSIANIFTSSI